MTSQNTDKSFVDDLLTDWHRWSSQYRVVTDTVKTAMFHNAKTPKHWDSTGEIADATIHKETMEAIDFVIYHRLQELTRAAITTYARNLCAKVAVFSNPRLPKDPLERAKMTGDALEVLRIELRGRGIM